MCCGCMAAGGRVSCRSAVVQSLSVAHQVAHQAQTATRHSATELPYYLGNLGGIPAASHRRLEPASVYIYIHIYIYVYIYITRPLCRCSSCPARVLRNDAAHVCGCGARLAMCYADEHEAVGSKPAVNTVA